MFIGDRSADEARANPVPAGAFHIAQHPARSGHAHAGLRPFGGAWDEVKDRYCLWIVSPKGYTHHQAFADVAGALSGAFASLGGNAPVAHHPSEWQGRLPIVLAPQLLTPNLSLALPEGSILFNMEQMDRGSVWMNATYMALLESHAVLDYSHRNARALRAAGISHAEVLPIGYEASLERVDRAAHQDIDVLFYGSLNERRIAVLNALIARGLHVVHAFNCYGSERDALIARAKIVLNIHFYESAIFESVRVSLLLANRACVVTEGEPDDDDIADLKDGMAVCGYGDLVDRCSTLLRDEKLRRDLCVRGHASIVARPQATFLSELIDRNAAPDRDTLSKSKAFEKLTHRPTKLGQLADRVRIYQPFLNNEQSNSLSRSAIPFDISFNTRPDTREYECFRALHRQHCAEGLADDVFWGFVSSKFELKTAMPLETFISLAEDARDAGYDCWAINPMIANAAMYENVWQQGILVGHTGMSEIAEFLKGEEYPVADLQGEHNFLLCNYVCGNERFWSGYFAFCEGVLQKLEIEASKKTAVGRAFKGGGKYGRDLQTSMRPFVIERLLGMYLTSERSPNVHTAVHKRSQKDFDQKFGARLGSVLAKLYFDKNNAIKTSDTDLLLSWNQNRIPLIKDPVLALHADDPPAWMLNT